MMHTILKYLPYVLLFAVATMIVLRMGIVAYDETGKRSC